MSSLKESILEVIEDNYYEVIQSDTVDVYLYPDIPSNILNGARSTYVSNELGDDILCIMDTTVLGTGKTGMAFTVNGNYSYDGFLSKPHFCEYGKYFTAINNIYFNSIGYQDLMTKINSSISEYKIDSAIDTVGGIVSGISNIIKAFSNEVHDDDIDLDHAKHKLWKFSRAFGVTYDDIRESPDRFLFLLMGYRFMCSEALGDDPEEELSELGMTEEDVSGFKEWYDGFAEFRITYPYVVYLDNIIKTDEDDVGLEDLLESYKERFELIMKECDDSIASAEKETYKATRQLKKELQTIIDMLPDA